MAGMRYILIACLAVAWCAPDAAAAGAGDALAPRLAIEDLAADFGAAYPSAEGYLARLGVIEAALAAGTPGAEDQLAALRQEALLANPLLNFGELLFVRRVAKAPGIPLTPSNKLALPPDPARVETYEDAVALWDTRRKQWGAAHANAPGQPQFDLAAGLPRNHQSNSSLPRTGYDNAIMAAPPRAGIAAAHTVYAPERDVYVGEVDLNFDGGKMLFTMSDPEGWQVYEMALDGAAPHALTSSPEGGVDNYDACYLPNGDIIFASTAVFQTVPCWHGIQEHRVANLYRMHADGTGIRQLCFDQDHDHYPAVLDNGQVVYTRWEYTGPRHEYYRVLMTMNPDGTGQRSLYGTNSWWPNSLYHTRAIPGHPTKLITVLSGYHGVVRQGDLLLLDTAKGWKSTDGVVQRIPGRGQPVQPEITEKLVMHHYPKFMHPYPLSDKYFLVSCRPTLTDNWGIYVVDVFDNIVPLFTDPGAALIEPIPLRKRTPPPAIPDRIGLKQEEAVVYLHDVYDGPGLAGVPRGTIKRLRVIAYHFNYPGIGGAGKVGMGGPWEVMRILGTTLVNADGSAVFRVPANTPLAVQPLDAEGKAVQLMRSWFTAMPGETVSCVGCHERPKDAPRLDRKLASLQVPAALTPWYGPARGFDFQREVQPVLDVHCAGCHDGTHKDAAGKALPDLRSEELVQDYQGMLLHPLERERMAPSAGKEVAASFGDRMRYTPAYDAILPYIRRVGAEDGVDLQIPGEYHVDTSPLFQMLRKGHHGVELDAESWDRLTTWVDMNAPCHGTWNDIYDVPAENDARRAALMALYGAPPVNPEAVPQEEQVSNTAVPQHDTMPPEPIAWASGYSLDTSQARAMQAKAGAITRDVDIGGGVTLRLVWIPPGKGISGEPASCAAPDERPVRVVQFDEGYWMGAFEVTNAQFALFDPGHDSGYCSKHGITPDAPGLWLNTPNQPVVRVSWERAHEFCVWLSKRTGLAFALPAEAQWEYACRAGTVTPWFFGDTGDDFSGFANLADRALGAGSPFPGHAVMQSMVGWCIGEPIDSRGDDGAVVTAPADSYAPNAWGLYDMLGNAAEWTASNASADGRKIVRGGSWMERPAQARAASRLDYPAWQGVHNVGFRVICAGKAAAPRLANAAE